MNVHKDLTTNIFMAVSALIEKKSGEKLNISSFTYSFKGYIKPLL